MRVRSSELDEQVPQRAQHHRRAANAVRGPHQHVDRAERLLLEPECLANAALDPVAIHRCRRVLPRDEDAKPGRAIGAALIVENESSETAARSTAKQPLKFDLAPEPTGGIQAKALRYCARNGYSASRRRPRARRLRNTLRPPGVRLRTRKPWRRARRVFEG